MKFSLHLPMDIDDRQEFQNAAAVREMAQGRSRRLLDHRSPGADHEMAACRRPPPRPLRGPGLRGGGDDQAAPAHAHHRAALPQPVPDGEERRHIDVLSDGRMILGIGSGYMKGEHEALGVDFASRGAAVDEAIGTMKLAWSGESVVRDGASFRAIGNLPKPVPVQKPNPPNWCDGNNDRAIRRAAEHCDGWSLFFTSGALSKTARTDDIADIHNLKAKIGVLRGHLDRVGRTLAAQPTSTTSSGWARKSSPKVRQLGKTA